ncbi:MAG: hypothetical protein ACREN5_16425, partial [Gemmatimonadales bacterium]
MTPIDKPAIPAAAVSYLRQNPDTAALFDTKYGVGQAVVLLSKPADAPLGTAGTLADIARGAVRGPLNALDETADFIASGINAVAGTNIEPANYADVLAPPQTTAGEITQGVTQFVTGLAGLGKFTKLAKLDGILGASKKAVVAGAAARSATVSAVAFDPAEGNVANFVERYPSLQNPVTEFLAVGDDDTAAEGRLKNALADVAVGVPLDLVMRGLKAIRAKKQGRLGDAEQHLEDLADAESLVARGADADAPADTTAPATAVDPAAAIHGTPTDTPKVAALVQDVIGAEARSVSTAEAAAA